MGGQPPTALPLPYDPRDAQGQRGSLLHSSCPQGHLGPQSGVFTSLVSILALDL